jgi:hypothetical protein
MYITENGRRLYECTSVSKTYQNYQNGAVNNQLTDCRGGGVCRVLGGNSESVDMRQEIPCPNSAYIRETERGGRREIIVRGQSYFSRLPK